MSDFPIRILQISYGMDRGGAETLIMNIYRNIDRTKVQFDFLLHNPERTAYEDEIESLGGRIHHIPRFLGYNKLSYDRALKDFLTAHPEYEIIHDHLMDSAEETFEVAKKLGRITIAHSHTVQNGHGIEDGIRFLFRRNLYKYADVRLACSKNAGLWLYRNKKDFIIINNGIDTEKYRFSEEARNRKRNELGVDDGTFLVGNVGRLVKDKNQERLIDVFSLFHKAHEGSKLMITGSGELEEVLKKKVKNKGLEESVIFTGERSDIPAILAASDIFLFPSLSEGLGIVLVEAQAEGLPCVFSSTIPEEVDLIPSLVNRVSLDEDDDVWVKKMEQVLKKKIPERETQHLAVRDKGYDIRKTAGIMENLYLELASRSSD